MGKIRITAIGDEEQEKAQKEKARLAREAKKIEKKKEQEKPVEGVADEAAKIAPEKETKKTISKYAAKKKIVKRSERYIKAAQLVDKNKTYSLKEALELLPKIKLSNFDETVELHLNTITSPISGSIILPYGTGKKTRVAIISMKNPKEADELLKEIEKGVINFDILVATPDMMPRLAKVARILGPKGLMPNPKNGTITPKPEEIAKKYEGGQINFKTEAKMPLMHLVVGKLSFGEEKLRENIQAMLEAVKKTNIKKAVLKSTMSTGIRINY